MFTAGHVDDVNFCDGPRIRKVKLRTSTAHELPDDYMDFCW